MILAQHPTDYGIDRQMWTGAILSEVIAQRWQVRLKDSRIYELLAELGLSYQRAHRDYANANRQAQQQWVETVKKKLQHQPPEEKTVFFDEFAVYDRPSLFYGWAERNTRPEIKSDESTRHKLNGFLCVDALTGEEFLRLSTTLVEIEQQLEQFLQSHQFLGSQQVRKTLNFIFSLVV